MSYSVTAKVEARLQSAVVGSMMQKLSRSLYGEDFISAPLRNPPIETGMMDTLENLKRITMKATSVSQAEYQQVPELLRRLRYLLRIYYDAKDSGRRPAEFKYCDAPDINDVGLDLHRAGLFLQLSPARLRALFSAAPDMSKFLLDEQIDIGRGRLEAQTASDAVHADPEADDNDRERVTELEDKSGSDLAAYQMIWFVADLLVAFVLIPPVDEAERRRAERAMGRLVEYSTQPMWRRALGDPLTDSMRPIYQTKEVLIRFAHAGGLPALFDDWAQSVAKDNLCKKAIETLSTRAWEHQTPESLQGIMQGLINKLETDGEELVTTPLFARFMHEIYSRYGLDPFLRASSLSHSIILFLFLHRRISRKPDAYRSVAALRTLLEKYANVPRTTRRRHGWIVLPVSGRWDLFEFSGYGCANAACLERKALAELKEHRVRGMRDPDVEDRLFRWGAASKACKSCLYVSYCSRTCQKADWRRHKPECQQHSAKDPTQVEAEI